MLRRSASRKGATVPASSAQASKAKEQEKIDGLFATYADKLEEGNIGPEGIEKLCRDLALDPTDIRVLLLAWKMQAARMGYFTQEEWRQGLRALHSDSIEKLRKALGPLQHEIPPSSDAFRDFFRFAFTYCLTEPGQKTLDVETAATMLQIVGKSSPFQEEFSTFMQEQTEYKAINLDQWTSFLRFGSEVKGDMSNYDENMAWPVLYDSFVEWFRSKE